jgi:hypothetical protein
VIRQRFLRAGFAGFAGFFAVDFAFVAVFAARLVVFALLAAGFVPLFAAAFLPAAGCFEAVAAFAAGRAIASGVAAIVG